MRIYGALMWSMGKVMRTPEVLRVYIGSYWDQPLVYTDNKELFELESKDLMRDLRGILLHYSTVLLHYFKNNFHLLFYVIIISVIYNSFWIFCHL